MPAPVTSSVTTTVRITPTRSARAPHANFPTAPPMKTSMSASPTERHRRALADQQEGQEGEEPGARGVVDDVDRGDRGEGAHVADPGAAPALRSRAGRRRRRADPRAEAREQHEDRRRRPPARRCRRPPPRPASRARAGRAPPRRAPRPCRDRRRSCRCRARCDAARSRRPRATSEDESGCWQPEPRPATTRQASRATKLPVRPGDQEAERGDRGARREQPRLAAALRENARRHLEGGHAAGVERLEQPDLREAQAELGRPDRQQHVQDVGEAVVDEVRPAGDGEDGAGAAGHRPRLFHIRDGAGKCGRAGQRGWRTSIRKIMTCVITSAGTTKVGMKYAAPSCTSCRSPW